jgi:hypothetical protein
MLLARSSTINVSPSSLGPDPRGLGDPPLETDDQEEIARAATLPPQHPLPAHLSSFERRRSRIDIEVSFTTESADASLSSPQSLLIRRHSHYGSTNPSHSFAATSTKSHLHLMISPLLIACVLRRIL